MGIGIELRHGLTRRTGRNRTSIVDTALPGKRQIFLCARIFFVYHDGFSLSGEISAFWSKILARNVA
jgi:hypothetical protein